jgi:ABC-type multidrug transport system fused ATPase/permease subunit
VCGILLAICSPPDSLDEESTKIVDAVLRSSFDGWTIIAVVHNLRSILDFDQVIVLDKGKLMEIGQPAALLAQGDSKFRLLYDRLANAT